MEEREEGLRGERSHRILVTGSRGKSSLVRLLCAGLEACGVSPWGRITGVLPRQIGPGGERLIERTAPAHVEEMRWWLGQVPPGASVVLENSAVAPDLQPLAARWLVPCLVVWTNARPDHPEAWDPGEEGAARALAAGIPEGCPVAAGREALPWVRRLLPRSPLREARPEEPLFGEAPFGAENRGLALAALEGLGLDGASARRGMVALPPDVADYRVLPLGAARLASAFAANEPESTERLFEATGWTPEETTLLYHHRPDRPGRLAAFLPWIVRRPWREVVFSRDRSFWGRFAPRRGPGGLGTWRDLTGGEDLARWVESRGRVFGCGNVAGSPLELLRTRREGGQGV